MAIINSDFLAGVLTNFRSLFATQFEAADSGAFWREIAMEIESTTDTESHNWLGTPPAMQDVTQRDLIVEGLHSFNYSIANKEWKNGIEVKRSTFEDDKLNLIRPRLDQLALEAASHPGRLVMALAVTNGLAYDGTAFFADTRVIGRSANIDNQIAGGSDPTVVANFQLQLAAASAQMFLFQDDQGRPMGLVGNVIMVPAALRQVAYQALNANQGSITQPVLPASLDGVVRASGYTIVANPFLTDANDWYLLHAGGALKPFIFQSRLKPALEGITTPTSESGVIHSRYIYTARYRGEVGYGDPRYAVKVTNT